MTPEQLTLDGGAVPYPLPRPHRLTERQRDLLRTMHRHNAIGLPTATREAGLFYADAHGARVLAFEDVLRDSTLLALLTAPPASGSRRTP